MRLNEVHRFLSKDANIDVVSIHQDRPRMLESVTELFRNMYEHTNRVQYIGVLAKYFT